MNHIVFLVEDLSTRHFLDRFLKRWYEDDFSFDIINFQGKSDLIKRLPGYLKGYKSWAPDNYRYFVLIDRDQESCTDLKDRLEAIVFECDLVTKRAGVDYQALTWIATEEIEAWYMGDFAALREVYPKLQDKSNVAKFRNPDAILGGTWESLEKELKSAGYYQSGLLKLDIASKMGDSMQKDNNRSTSFNGFIARLDAL